MHRKISVFLLTLILLARLGIPVAAAEQTGSIGVTLHTTKGEVTLYHAGIPADGGYSLTDTFGGGFIKEEDAYSPYLARWLAEAAENGEKRILDADGSAVFSRLEAGLYLVEQTQGPDDETIAAPFLISLPYYGQWNIEASPKTASSEESPKTGQGPEPFLGAAGMLFFGSGLILCLTKRKKER